MGEPLVGVACLMKHHHDARLCASTFCSLYDGIDKRLRNIEQHWRKFNRHRYQWCSFSCYSSWHVLHGVVENGWTLKIKRSTSPRSIKDWPLYNIRRCLQRMQFALAHNKYWLWWYCMIRKSKDYVYGIWVYKALGIWKGYYKGYEIPSPYL